jgi:hypothetical protein
VKEDLSIVALVLVITFLLTALLVVVSCSTPPKSELCKERGGMTVLLHGIVYCRDGASFDIGAE